MCMVADVVKILENVEWNFSLKDSSKYSRVRGYGWVEEGKKREYYTLGIAK